MTYGYIVSSKSWMSRSWGLGVWNIIQLFASNTGGSETRAAAMPALAGDGDGYSNDSNDKLQKTCTHSMPPLPLS